MTSKVNVVVIRNESNPSTIVLLTPASRTAVKLNPNDPTLWNKLGATQANSSKSAEAVSAYKK